MFNNQTKELQKSKDAALAILNKGRHNLPLCIMMNNQDILLIYHERSKYYQGAVTDFQSGIKQVFAPNVVRLVLMPVYNIFYLSLPVDRIDCLKKLVETSFNKIYTSRGTTNSSHFFGSRSSASSSSSTSTSSSAAAFLTQPEDDGFVIIEKVKVPEEQQKLELKIVGIAESRLQEIADREREQELQDTQDLTFMAMAAACCVCPPSS